MKWHKYTIKRRLTEIISADHVKHSARSAHNSVNWFFFESKNVFWDTGSTNTGMALGIHVITKSHQNLLNLNNKTTAIVIKLKKLPTTAFYGGNGTLCISIESEFWNIILPWQNTRLQTANFSPSDNAHSQIFLLITHQWFSNEQNCLSIFLTFQIFSHFNFSHTSILLMHRGGLMNKDKAFSHTQLGSHTQHTNIWTPGCVLRKLFFASSIPQPAQN